MEPEYYYRAGAYFLGLLVTLALAAWLTPRHWWRRPNARALLVLVAGSWGVGSLVLPLLRTQMPPPRSMPPTALLEQPAPATRHILPTAFSLAAPAAGQDYRVWRSVNLRAGAGTGTARIAVVPAGASIRPTGVHQGDWWQIRAVVDGRQQTGWASSLWLRRPDEATAPK
jgi:hypothetical protein